MRIGGTGHTGMINGRLAGIGVGDYTAGMHKPLKYAVDDVVALSELLGGSFTRKLLKNPTEEEARAFLKSLKRSQQTEAGSSPTDGPLVMVWSGHGLPAAGGLRLLAKNSGADADDGLAVADIVAPCALSGANQLLFVFDTCFSGDAISAEDLATQIMRETQEAGQVWVGVVTSCLSLETARDGLFGQRLRKVLESGPDMPELQVRWSAHNQYVRGDDVCDAVLKEWGGGTQSPDFRSRGSAWWMFPNPLYRAGAPEQVVEHLLRAARSGAELDEQTWFTGRTAEVNTVVQWVRERRPGVYVVTGSAGTGKSAILGRVVSLSHPEERERLLSDGHPWSHELPEERSVSAHVHARGLTADLAADQLAGQLVQRGVLAAQDARRNASELVGEIQRAVEDGAPPPVLVVDGLDEARGQAFKVADELLTRLAAYAVVIVSTREMQRGDEGASLLRTLAPEGAGIDLDDASRRERGREDLTDYLRLRLRDIDSLMDPEAIAGHLLGRDSIGAQQTFLLARLVADQLSTAPVDTSAKGWGDAVSRSVEHALDSDLFGVLPAPGGEAAESPSPADLARVILHALTWGFGAGLPEEEWLVVANAEAPEGVEVTREHIIWALGQLGRHIVQDGEDGIAVYRMAHQSLADHLRPVYRGSRELPFNPDALAVSQALLRRYRARLDAGISAKSSSYLWFYGWRHAADAGPAGLALLRSLAGETAALLPDVGMAATSIGDRLQYWGLMVEALPHAEEAVDLWRALAEENPAHLPSFANALNNLGSSYSDVGRPTDALPPTEEAVDMWRTLAEENPAHLPSFANALNNLGVRYSELGRPTDALPPTEEAVDLWRVLAEENPAHLPSFANALNNLGNRYSDLGRLTNALPPTQEALDLWRVLAEEDPAHLPDLAGALNNLGICYSDLGRPTDALPPTEEAVDMWRTLAEENPAHLPSFANALNNLGVRFSNLGRPADALPPTQEAVRLRRVLAEENPAHLPDLAGALNNLGVRYSDLGRPADALPATQEAVRLRRVLAEENPAHLPDLAGALNNLGANYSELGRPTDALPPTQEALDMWRTLAEENPAHLPNLANALNNLGNRYSHLGRPTDALPPTQEAVRLRRVLAEENPAHLPSLANALNNLGVRYSDLGRPTDALPPTQEALDMWRTLAEENPAHLPSLASALNNLSIRYSELGRPTDALPLAEEALDMWRTLAEENPAHLPNLASALNNLGIRYSELGRPTDALPPTQEAVRLRRVLAEENPAHLPDLANALNNLGNYYSELGRPTEEAWTTVLTQVTPDDAAFLLLSRSVNAMPGNPAAIAWLVDVEQIAATAPDFDLADVLHSDGRRHRAVDHEGFDSAWLRLTGKEPPAWLTVDPELLAQAAAWIDTESYEAEQDHLATHPELLSPEADNAVDEALLGLGQEVADRYRDLRQQARSTGVEAAYRPLLNTILASEFVTAEPGVQRTLLESRHVDLLDDSTRQAVARYTSDDDPEISRRGYRANALLTLAQLNAQHSALDALDAPAKFRALLSESARSPQSPALEAIAILALTAATDDALVATAEYHLALAAAIDNDLDYADTLLASACDRLPEAVPAWIADLADIARHHPAALTLISRLTERLSAAQPEEHDAPLPD
ncbi:tetratricopeptide repeat protein [Streptomyces sp. NPDC048420]|uniref:tetratricopeptide repeat protein n=1 Tax=Streptomyces sp. NPDC048420 TaxID=3155755 RepID=UPI003416FC2A